MENIVVATFLYIAAFAVALSGFVIIILRKYMDRVMVHVYGGDHFPFWFWPASLGLAVMFVYVVYEHFVGAQTWAGWIVAAMIGLGMPVQWAAVVWNKNGRDFLAHMSGELTFVAVGVIRIAFGVFLYWLAMNA